MSHHDIYRRLKSGMIGMLSMNNAEAGILYSAIDDGDVYVETGTFCGGSAIIAAQKAIRIYTIDSMFGGYFVANGVQPLDILINLHRFDVAYKTSIIAAKSDPWPLPDYIIPDVFLIDGGHDYPTAKHDWSVADRIARRAILVHDYNRPQYPGVIKMVSEIDTNKWQMTRNAGAMALFERLTYDNN